METRKVVLIVLLGILTFSLIACYRDDGYYRNVQVELQNAVTFQEKEIYQIGDTLYFDVGFSRYVEEQGYSNLLDIYATTKETKYGYNFWLSKFSAQSGGYNTISINLSSTLFNGKVLDSNYYDFYSELDTEKEEYVSQIGIVLKEEGDYTLEVSGLHGYDYNPDEVDLYLHFGEQIEFKVEE